MFKNGCKKAFTLSYDDGVTYDARVAEICNEYGVKCTFNINPGLTIGRNSWTYKGVTVGKLEVDVMRDVYRGHEIASHSWSHPYLDRISEEECENEMRRDAGQCEKWFGFRPVGMAYPMGTYSDTVVNVLKRLGYRYARTTEDSRDFAGQSDLLRFKPTCHHNDERLFELADRFINGDADGDTLFYVWGHSYEFASDGNFDRLEKLCRLISNAKDVFCGTNSEVLLNGESSCVISG